MRDWYSSISSNGNRCSIVSWPRSSRAAGSSRLEMLRRESAGVSLIRANYRQLRKQMIDAS
jgi:hypothetical protein